MQSQEGVRLLVIPIEDNKFTVGSHDILHLSLVVDDHRATETSVLILIHAHIAVVRVELANVALVRSIWGRNKPIETLAISFTARFKIQQWNANHL